MTRTVQTTTQMSDHATADGQSFILVSCVQQDGQLVFNLKIDDQPLPPLNKDALLALSGIAFHVLIENVGAGYSEERRAINWALLGCEDLPKEELLQVNMINQKHALWCDGYVCSGDCLMVYHDV